MFDLQAGFAEPRRWWLTSSRIESVSDAAGPERRAPFVPDLTADRPLGPRAPDVAGGELAGRRTEEGMGALDADLGLRRRGDGGAP